MGGILDVIMQAQNGAGIQNLARQFGLSGDDTARAVSQMLPGLSRGVKNNIASPGGLDGMLDALRSGGHQKYLDEPDRLNQAEARQDGNNILGHILGSKDASRQLAGETAAGTGLDAGMLQQMLPLVATMLMGGMSKQSSASGAAPGEGAGSGGLGSMLSSLLDADQDGSVVDDLMGMAKKLF